MPLYEFSCPIHGRFEKLMPISMSEVESEPCPRCGQGSMREASLYSPFPDTLWSGVVDPTYGYVTSSSQLKRIIRDRHDVVLGDRADREGFEKHTRERRKSIEAKSEKRIEEWVEKTFGPEGLGLGGAEGERVIRETAGPGTGTEAFVGPISKPDAGYAVGTD